MTSQHLYGPKSTPSEDKICAEMGISYSVNFLGKRIERIALYLATNLKFVFQKI